MSQGCGKEEAKVFCAIKRQRAAQPATVSFSGKHLNEWNQREGAREETLDGTRANNKPVSERNKKNTKKGKTKKSTNPHTK